MQINQTPLAGCFVIKFEAKPDTRGFFMRSFDTQMFRDAGLETAIDHSGEAFNTKAGTLRGLHFQAAPLMEAKLVRCTQGAIFDVAVDIRPLSTNFGRWFGITLTSEQPCALYLSKGLAHGYMTLTDSARVSYQISTPYTPEYSRGILWSDLDLAIDWPHIPQIISEIDQKLPLLKDLAKEDLGIGLDQVR